MLRKLLSKLIGSKQAKKAGRKKPSKKKPVSRKKPSKKTPKKAPRRPVRGKPSPKKKTPPKKALTARAAKGSAPVPGGEEIGEVVAFFRIPVVAVIKLSKGSLRIGDRIWIHGHTTDLKQVIGSMQIDHQPIQEARKGQELGIKVSARARRGDRVYRIAS